MDTGHNHPPRCCCIDPQTNEMSDATKAAFGCPLCPDHGELAQLANTECPSCHQLPGRPPTDYCQMPAWHAARHIPIKTADHPGDWTATLTTQPATTTSQPTTHTRAHHCPTWEDPEGCRCEPTPLATPTPGACPQCGHPRHDTGPCPSCTWCP